MTAVNRCAGHHQRRRGATAAINLAENQTAVTTVTSTDVDGGAPAYSIVGGTDAVLFTLDATTGALTFNVGPNFESPGDAGANNLYDVTVQVADGNGGTDLQVFSIMVTDVNEGLPPTTTPPSIPPSLVPQSPPPTGVIPPAGSPPLPSLVVGPPVSTLPNPEDSDATFVVGDSPGGTTLASTDIAAASAPRGRNIPALSIPPMHEPRVYLEENVVTLIPQAVKEVALDEHTLARRRRSSARSLRSHSESWRRIYDVTRTQRKATANS